MARIRKAGIRYTRWIAQIDEQFDGPKRWIGRFLTENLLATARSSVALCRYGAPNPVATSIWEYEEASDHLLGDDPASFSTRIPELANVESGSIFLRHGEHRLELWWRGPHSVIGHCTSDDSDLDCAITDASLDRSDSIQKNELIQWTCSCCNVLLGTFTAGMHIGRDTAFDIFKHILITGNRPQQCTDGPVEWMTVDAD